MRHRRHKKGQRKDSILSHKLRESPQFIASQIIVKLVFLTSSNRMGHGGRGGGALKQLESGRICVIKLRTFLGITLVVHD